MSLQQAGIVSRAEKNSLDSRFQFDKEGDEDVVVVGAGLVVDLASVL
jgi:hypothetical protein